MLGKRTLKTTQNDLREITKEVQDIVTESGIKDGLVVVWCPHTTAGILATSFWDPKGHEDMMEDFDRIVPMRVNYKHQDTPSDAAAHIKSAVVGPSLSAPVEDGKVLLGHSTGIFFAEFDGPRDRQYFVKVYGK